MYWCSILFAIYDGGNMKKAIVWIDESMTSMHWSGRDKNAQLVMPWMLKNKPGEASINKFVQVEITIRKASERRK